VDPAFKVTAEIKCDLQLVKTTSDEFFARGDALTHFSNNRIDLAFVDGLHLFEYALRDFMNVERFSEWTSVIVFDDMLPRSIAEASRDRGGMVAWAGDVFKLAEVLARFRPDLLLLPLDTDPTGVLVVLGADCRSRVLHHHYDEIVSEYIYSDPQRLPELVQRRETAFDPTSLVRSGIWTALMKARDFGLAREDGWSDLLRSVETAVRPAARRELAPANMHAKGERERRSKPTPPKSPIVRARRAVGGRLRPLGRRAHRLVARTTGWAR
jgi:hypothetical protein